MGGQLIAPALAPAAFTMNRARTDPPVKSTWLDPSSSYQTYLTTTRTSLAYRRPFHLPLDNGPDNGTVTGIVMIARS